MKIKTKFEDFKGKQNLDPRFEAGYYQDSLGYIYACPGNKTAIYIASNNNEDDDGIPEFFDLENRDSFVKDLVPVYGKITIEIEK